MDYIANLFLLVIESNDQKINVPGKLVLYDKFGLNTSANVLYHCLLFSSGAAKIAPKTTTLPITSQRQLNLSQGGALVSSPQFSGKAAAIPVRKTCLINLIAVAIAAFSKIWQISIEERTPMV